MYEINKLAPTVSVKMANMGVLCAVFIVLLHSGCGGMTRVAVPYFFLAAGYFLAGHIGETGWWHREVAKRVQSLLVPMWIWGAVSIMIELLLQWGIRLTGYDYHGESLSFLYRLLKSLGVLFTVNMGVLWFVRMLFFLVVISPLLRGGGKSVNLLRLMIFAGLYGWFELSDLEQGALWNFFEYGFSLRGLLYFSVGIYLRQYPIRLNISKLSLVVLVVVSGALVGFNVTALIMVPVCMLTLYLLMPSWKAYGNGYSFPIYLLHMDVMLILTAGLAAVGIRSSTCHAVWLVVLRFVVCLVTSIFLTRLLRRYAPRFARLAFGGR